MNIHQQYINLSSTTRGSLNIFEIETRMKINKIWRSTIRELTRLSRSHSTFKKETTGKLIDREDDWYYEKIKEKTKAESKSWIIDQDFHFDIDVCIVLYTEFSCDLLFFTPLRVSRVYRHIQVTQSVYVRISWRSDDWFSWIHLNYILSISNTGNT